MNITKLTEQYVSEHPSIKDCVKKKLVNYSKLSRLIIKENSLKSSDFDAVLIAARRYFWKTTKSASAEEKVRALLAKSRLEIKNKIIVAVIERSIFTESLLELEKRVKKSRNIFYAIEGTDAITLITAYDFLDDIRKSFRSSIIRTSTDLALVVVSSPEEIEETPGVVAHLTSLLSDRGINIVEHMSCWSETLFVVSEKDIAKVLEALKFS